MADTVQARTAHPQHFDIYARPPGVDPSPLDPYARRHHLYQPQAPTLSRWGEYPWLLAEYIVPDAEVEETDDAYVLDIDMPGVKRGDIDASISGRRLTIAGERQPKERQGVVRRQGGDVGRYRYEVELPDGVDATGTTAALNDGVLNVRVPKATSEQPRHIKVT
jgi:HSP20 family molecular chaperone IbpA